MDCSYKSIFLSSDVFYSLNNTAPSQKHLLLKSREILNLSCIVSIVLRTTDHVEENLFVDIL